MTVFERGVPLPPFVCTVACILDGLLAGLGDGHHVIGLQIDAVYW